MEVSIAYHFRTFACQVGIPPKKSLPAALLHSVWMCNFICDSFCALYCSELYCFCCNFCIHELMHCARRSLGKIQGKQHKRFAKLTCSNSFLLLEIFLFYMRAAKSGKVINNCPYKRLSRIFGVCCIVIQSFLHM